VFERLMAEDKQALRKGGPGFGDWRDERDREELAPRKGPIRIPARRERRTRPT
jgi:hypothetical protein